MGILSTDILREPVTPASELGSTARSERASLMKRRRVDSAHFQWGLRRNDTSHTLKHTLCPAEDIWVKTSFAGGRETHTSLFEKGGFPLLLDAGSGPAWNC
jgi:hypothetical protein